MAKYTNLISPRKKLNLKSGDTVKNGNLSQEKMNTPILEGLKNLTFEGVNLMNVKLGILLRKESGWRIYPNNIRVKDCLIHQEDVVPEPEPTEVERISMALDDLTHRHDTPTVLSVIAQKYELQAKLNGAL